MIIADNFIDLLRNVLELDVLRGCFNVFRTEDDQMFVGFSDGGLIELLFSQSIAGGRTQQQGHKLSPLLSRHRKRTDRIMFPSTAREAKSSRGWTQSKRFILCIFLFAASRPRCRKVGRVAMIELYFSLNAAALIWRTDKRKEGGKM